MKEFDARPQHSAKHYDVGLDLRGGAVYSLLVYSGPTHIRCAPSNGRLARHQETSQRLSEP